jgi:ribonuclease BN (tRNA processing enzyme)
VQLWVLGANGTYPTAGRPTAGYLLSLDGTRVWIDAGSGTFGALLELMDPADLDALIISHMHVDHCADVFALYHYLRFGPVRRSPLPLIVPEGATERLSRFLDSGGGSHLTEAFAPRTPEPGEVAEVGGISFRFGPSDHPVPTLQMRAEAGGRSMVYSGDTGTESDLIGLAAGANTLLAEATFPGPDKPAPHHLTATEAGEIAREAGVERLILTHLLPTLDPQLSIAEAAAAFDGDIMVAEPNLEVLI